MFVKTNIIEEVAGQERGLLLQADALSGHPALEKYMHQADVVYLDPPFMTGGVFQRSRPYGSEGWRKGRPRVVSESYHDKFASREAYGDFIRKLIEKARELLSPSGVLYLHLDWRSAALGRMICDELFGEERYLNEIVWAYQTGGRSDRHFSRKHDTVLFYSMSDDYLFDQGRIAVPAPEKRNHMRIETDPETGERFRTIRSGDKVYKYPADAPVYPSDVWTDIPHLQQRDPARTGYPTQKPLALLERLLKPVLRENGLVVDLCCGSGTTLVAAKNLGARFVGVDNSAGALHTAAGRLGDGFRLIADTTADVGVPEVFEGAYEHAFELLACRGTGLPEDRDPTAFVEQIRTGVIRDGILYANECFCRTKILPELPHAFGLPEGAAGLSVTDALGRRCIYEWVPDGDVLNAGSAE